MELIRAKVPILKFRDAYSQVDVDLNCNNAVGIRNTHLLNSYSQRELNSWHILLMFYYATKNWRPLLRRVKIHGYYGLKVICRNVCTSVIRVFQYMVEGRCKNMQCVNQQTLYFSIKTLTCTTENIKLTFR